MTITNFDWATISELDSEYYWYDTHFQSYSRIDL